MKTKAFSPTKVVAEVLAISPAAAPAFIEMRLDCPGCAMVKFCTLQDVCSHYEIDIQTLIATLKERLVQNASH